METKRFNYSCIDGDIIRLRLDKITMPILWNHKGIYGLIPFARIKNALELWKDNLLSTCGGTPMADFNWPDVIPVSPQIANALLGDDKDDKCTYK